MNTTNKNKIKITWWYNLEILPKHFSIPIQLCLFIYYFYPIYFHKQQEETYIGTNIIEPQIYIKNKESNNSGRQGRQNDFSRTHHLKQHFPVFVSKKKIKSIHLSSLNEERIPDCVKRNNFFPYPQQEMCISVNQN